MDSTHPQSWTAAPSSTVSRSPHGMADAALDQPILPGCGACTRLDQLLVGVSLAWDKNPDARLWARLRLSLRYSHLVVQGSVVQWSSTRQMYQCANNFYGAPKGTIAVLGVFASLPLLRRRITGFHSISHFVQDFAETNLLRNGKTAPNQKDIKPSAIIPSFLVGLDDTVGLAPKYIDQLPTQPFMLFVGAIMRRKGIYQLLEAYQQLVNPPPLVLIGTLEHDSPASFPPGVVVLQNFPHSCVMVAWERCLFGVVPSLWPEPLGAVVFEAMSRGKAVIGTKPGGHEEMIIDGETGYLVPQGDVEALRRAMQCLIDNDAMREAFGTAGQARLAQFTAEAALPQFEALYQRVITAGHPVS